MQPGMTIEQARERLQQSTDNASATARLVGLSLVVCAASLSQFFAQVELLKQQHADAEARAAQWREIAIAKAAR